MMSGGGSAVGALVLAALVSATSCVAWMRFATARRLVDVPGGRRVHTQVTPRGGGIGIALAMVIASAGFALTQAGDAYPGWSACAGIALFALIGFIDDLQPLPAAPKLTLQFAAALAMVWPLQLFPTMPAVVVVAAATIATVFMVNVWNFMDGSHGLVTVQGLLIAIALALLPGQIDGLRVLAAALAGACLGFLPFNFPQARVFLGDVGSHALAAAVLALLLLALHYRVIGAAQALLLSSVLLVDAGITLLRRAGAGRVLWQAHREHLYQFAVRRGRAPWQVCLVYGAVCLVAIAIALIAGGQGTATQWVLAATWFIVLAVAHGLARAQLLRRRGVPA